MSLLTNLLIGRTGLAAAQAGLNATSHNVANASVPGATRRTALTSVSDPLRRGDVWLGQGARIDGMGRPEDRDLTERRIQTLGEARRSELVWDDLRSLERIYDASQGDTSKSTLEKFFDSLTRATSDPADLSLRRGIVRAAQDLATYVSRDARALAGAKSDEVEDMIATLPEINQRLGELAEINAAIASSQNTNNLGAGDLMDRRDQLLTDLGGLTGIQADISPDGTVTVFLGGHAAVSGQNARTVDVVADPTTGEPRVYLSHSSDERIDVTNGIGGELGGRQQTWNIVDGLKGKVDDFAQQFADAFNAQHGAGFDLNGDAGGDMFSYDAANPGSTLVVHPDIVDDAALIAFGATSPTLAGDVGNLRALMDLEDNDTLIAGRRSASDWLTDLTTELGTAVSRAQDQAISQDILVQDLEELHQNLHGIDLDEEATNLLLYQTAYQAAARVIAANDALMQNLLELV